MIKLHPLERGEVGDVVGKKLLHVQCHFGLDTLSWARLGAQVTDIDYAEKAISLKGDLLISVNFKSCSIWIG